jgi:hypothetical protein
VSAIVAKVVGAGLFGDQTRARHRRLRRGNDVFLVRDRNNDYDVAATMVMVSTLQGMRPVGYIPSSIATDVALDLDRGQVFRCKVIKGYAFGQVPWIEIRKIGRKKP